ncbi:MAG: ferredoxin family protein [Anaerolineae bacterium]|nr:ferredoxin family protein [Anaerolineae bacterium]
MLNSYKTNTLRYEADLCIHCGLCSSVCPHGVFFAGGRLVQLAHPEACMECGACQLNCPTGAITVESGVGCAAAMIRVALTGRKEATCGGQSASPNCCSNAQAVRVDQRREK